MEKRSGRTESRLSQSKLPLKSTIDKGGTFHFERRCRRGSKEIRLKEKSQSSSEEKSFTSKEKEIAGSTTFVYFLKLKAGKRQFSRFFLPYSPEKAFSSSKTLGIVARTCGIF
jgi:hypothetical protein